MQFYGGSEWGGGYFQAGPRRGGREPPPGKLILLYSKWRSPITIKGREGPLSLQLFQKQSNNTILVMLATHRGGQPTGSIQLSLDSTTRVPC